MMFFRIQLLNARVIWRNIKRNMYSRRTWHGHLTEGERLIATTSLYRRVIAGALALLLGVTGLLTAPLPTASADEVGDAKASLEEAQAKLDEIAAECDDLAAKADRLQEEIDANSQTILELQQAVYEGRDSLGRIAVYEYRVNSFDALLGVFFGSNSLQDFIRNMDYVDTVMENQSQELSLQMARKEHFEQMASLLDAQKAEQDAAITDLMAKREEAEKLVAEATADLANAEAEADAAARLKQQAAALAQTKQEIAAAEDDVPFVNEGNTKPGGEGSASDPSPVDPGSLGWQTGLASAYGGVSDPNTPNPGTTANGSVCNDTSMGVAIPMSTPNVRSYFGRTVEISYGGQTVFATINDCGGMGGGSRALDLQPGVWKAFGFSTCRAWGLRTVSYRIL